VLCVLTAFYELAPQPFMNICHPHRSGRTRIPAALYTCPSYSLLEMSFIYLYSRYRS